MDFEKTLITLEPALQNFKRWGYAYENHMRGMEEKREKAFQKFAAGYTKRTGQDNVAKIKQAYRRKRTKDTSRKGKRVTPSASAFKCLSLLIYFEQLIPETHSDLRHALTAAYTVKKWWQDYVQAPEDYSEDFQAKDKLKKLYTQSDYTQATAFEELVRTTLKEAFVAKVEAFENNTVCVGIEHNRDGVRNADAVNDLSIDKPHLHIMVYLRDNRASNFLSSAHAKRVSFWLKKLGVYFTKEDAYLLDAGAIEPVRTSPEQCVNYDLHQTPESIKDGKSPYYEEEIFTNLKEADLHALISLYKGISRKNKLSDSDWDSLALEAEKKGKNLEDFDAWIEEVLNTRQQAMAVTKVVKQKYTRAVLERLGSSESDLTRCSIVITGKGNTGKSYATRHALSDMRLKAYKAIKGSGKYDGLTSSHDAIIFDDVLASDARNVFENAVVPLYRRNHDLAIWGGKYAIATTNLTPDAFIRKTAGLHLLDDHEDADEKAIYEAIKSRLFFAHIDEKTGRLVMDKPQSRGTLVDKQKHDDLFHDFQKHFEKYSVEYTKQRQEDDYEDLKHHFSKWYMAGLYSGTAMGDVVYFDYMQGLDDIKEHKYAYFKKIIPELFGAVPTQFRQLVKCAESWTDENDVKIATDTIGTLKLSPMQKSIRKGTVPVNYAW